LLNQEEGSGERTIHREPIPENPPQIEAEKKMTNMITKLEQRCDLLSEVVQRHDKGKASLVDKGKAHHSPMRWPLSSFPRSSNSRMFRSTPDLKIRLSIWKIFEFTRISIQHLTKWHARPFLLLCQGMPRNGSGSFPQSISMTLMVSERCS
jgi:hypothetical protein